jgi:hypothetical protein
MTGPGPAWPGAGGADPGAAGADPSARGADPGAGGVGGADPGAGLPDPDARPCADCGHVWFEGERRHEYVTGPPPPAFRKGRLEVVCVLCGRQRDRGAAPG